MGVLRMIRRIRICANATSDLDGPEIRGKPERRLVLGFFCLPSPRTGGWLQSQIPFSNNKPKGGEDVIAVGTLSFSPTFEEGGTLPPPGFPS
ncbi:hypothetical protein NPIL_106541 [Nephila pilipes]|uniref:Uncharacterized protein n=1 Tax=Nephila pilipes TaxID=299642 RepID=A0A8X6N685_NEPPI|nr:hypothetical protein NPIL_106541 [Nephila pilipes]